MKKITAHIRPAKKTKLISLSTGFWKCRFKLVVIHAQNNGALQCWTDDIAAAAATTNLSEKTVLLFGQFVVWLPDIRIRTPRFNQCAFCPMFSFHLADMSWIKSYFNSKYAIEISINTPVHAKMHKLKRSSSQIAHFKHIWYTHTHARTRHLCTFRTKFDFDFYSSRSHSNPI